MTTVCLPGGKRLGEALMDVRTQEGRWEVTAHSIFALLINLTFLLPVSLRAGSSRYVRCESALVFSVSGGMRRPGWSVALPLCPYSHPHCPLGPAELQVCFPPDPQDSCPCMSLSFGDKQTPGMNIFTYLSSSCLSPFLQPFCQCLSLGSDLLSPGLL